jgi:hypothetical protein
VAESYDVRAIGAEALLRDRRGWVVKRALGRVGDEVYVGPLCSDMEWAALIGDVLRLCGDEQPATGPTAPTDPAEERGQTWIAQRFIPQRAIPTPWGDRFVTLGAYVLDGRFAGYFARITPQSHVSHDALCVPVFAEAA